MSSARILLAGVAFGLAACAHTPGSDSLYLPDIRAAAPVLMVDAKIPPGFNDHVIIYVDHDGIARAAREGSLDAGIRSFSLAGYPYLLRPTRSSGSRGHSSTATATPVVVPAVNRPSPRPRPSTAPRESSPRRSSDSHRR